MMELRPCFYDYAGIPQDTRHAFDVLAQQDDVKLGGHLLGAALGTLGFKWRTGKSTLERRASQSQYLIALLEEYPLGCWLARFAKSNIPSMYLTLLASQVYASNMLFSSNARLHQIDTEYYEDYIWSTLFAKSLPESHKKHISKTTFWGSSLPYRFLNAAYSMPLPSVSFDTTDWDLYISQTPFPASLSDNTELVVRYHDTIPIQYPHTIKDPFAHNKQVVSALSKASRHAHFVCNSESTRDALIALCPQTESRSHVIPCFVSDNFYPEKDVDVSEVVASHIAPLLLDKDSDYETYSNLLDCVSQSFNGDYLLSVGTLEPRKNYPAIVESWEQVRKTTNRDIKLLIVGNPGWHMEGITKKLKAHFYQGNLFVLNEVSIGNLRTLYSNAIATVVASVAEGFSFSGIESMRCKTPIAASDIPVHREVYGDSARYFNPYSMRDTANALCDLVRLEGTDRKKIEMEGYSVSKKYTESEHACAWRDFVQNR